METLDLLYILYQIDQTDIHRTFYPTATKYTFFSIAQETFFRTDHMLGHKTSPSNFKKTEIIPRPQRNETREKHRRNMGKFTNMQKLNNACLNNQ